MELSSSKTQTKGPFADQGFHLIPRGDVAWLEWDLPGEKVNKLSSLVMNRFGELIDELRDSSYKAVVLISRKKNIFIAGADIEEIKCLNTEEEYAEAIELGQGIFNRLENLPMPTIAAIDGACVGGGCELVLACDYRIITDNKSTKIGLPEVRLGLIPGFGGCVRLPRVVGLQASLDIILSGKTVVGKKAVRMGLADECVPKELLEPRVQLLVNDVLSGKKGKRLKKFKSRGFVNGALESFVGRGIVLSRAKKMILKQTKGFYPAPLKALEVVKATYGSGNKTRSLEIEKKGFCEVAMTDVSQHLVNLFFLTEGVKKKTSMNVEILSPSHVGILGAGVMGGGIAQLAADKGYRVRMRDISHEALATSFRTAQDIWKKLLQQRRMTKYELSQKMALISGGLDFSGFQQMDVIIEAIVEDMNIKKAVIAEMSAHCREGCIIATNTSSLSVTEMAEAHLRPDNFVGMHFFNPVHKMPLVEIIRGEKTSDVTTATIFELSKKMGKTPVVVKDSPAFLVNRLLLPWLAEGMFLLEEGMSVEKMEHYLSNDFGMPMGTCRLLDEVGWDTAVKVLKMFREAMGERIQVPNLAETLFQTDRLGKKNSKGFFLYGEGGKEMGVDPSVYSELHLETPKDKLSREECIQRCMFQMINEASRALCEDEVVDTASEVDLAMIMGTGFPPFRGGLLRYADFIGARKIVETLEEYAARLGDRFKPSQSLVEMVKNGKSFYM